MFRGYVSFREGTTIDGRNLAPPVTYETLLKIRRFSMSTGEGFLPSTVGCPWK